MSFTTSIGIVCRSDLPFGKIILSVKYSLPYFNNKYCLMNPFGSDRCISSRRIVLPSLSKNSLCINNVKYWYWIDSKTRQNLTSTSKVSTFSFWSVIFRISLLFTFSRRITSSPVSVIHKKVLKTHIFQYTIYLVLLSLEDF